MNSLFILFIDFDNVLFLLLWALYLVKLKIIIVVKNKLVSFNIVAFLKLFDKCKSMTCTDEIDTTLLLGFINYFSWLLTLIDYLPTFEHVFIKLPCRRGTWQSFDLFLTYGILGANCNMEPQSEGGVYLLGLYFETSSIVNKNMVVFKFVVT